MLSASAVVRRRRAAPSSPSTREPASFASGDLAPAVVVTPRQTAAPTLPPLAPSAAPPLLPPLPCPRPAWWRGGRPRPPTPAGSPVSRAARGRLLPCHELLRAPAWLPSGPPATTTVFAACLSRSCGPPSLGSAPGRQLGLGQWPAASALHRLADLVSPPARRADYRFHGPHTQ